MDTNSVSQQAAKASGQVKELKGRLKLAKKENSRLLSGNFFGCLFVFFLCICIFFLFVVD
jgi:hypothetical protein